MEETIYPYLECPRFDICSVNDCPLSTIKRTNVEGDPETECKASRKVRMRIAEKYGLPNHGLTEKEIKREERRKKARERWNNLPEEEKQRRIEALKRINKKINAKTQ